jgi:hypothetical protein
MQFITKQFNHFLMPVKVAAMSAPSCNYYRGIPCDFNEPAIVIFAYWIGLRLHDSRKGRPKGKDIHHAKGAKTPAHRIINASRNGWIVLNFIRGRGIKADKHCITGVGKIPLAPKRVAILSAFGKYGAAFHTVGTPLKSIKECAKLDLCNTAGDHGNILLY